MTASELITILNTLPGDTEIKVYFSYCDDCGVTLEQHEVLDVSPEGELKTDCIVEGFHSYNEDYPMDDLMEEEYYDSADEAEYGEYLYNKELKAEEDKLIAEIEAAWKEHEASKIFQTAEEEDGYIEYQNTLYRQDRDLEETMEFAKSV